MPTAARKSQPLDPQSAGGPALRTFFRIADLWKLSAEEQMTLLGIASRSTYYKWRNEPPARLTPDLLERLSYIFGIYKDLQVLLPDPGAADAWIRRPNAAPLFNGQSALERMLSGHVADLYVVRRYLDAERGGWS
ncbi:MAG TPA: antitoxin Xre-like helix-turn-helix domain-containing protein [Longimicrobiaceae bacterium]|nr:antitoxin Xre-like helix-turn-helix domain-containing protein [Longimicrobiaceae bacterium]